MGLLRGLELTDRLVVFQVVKVVETLARGRVVVRTHGDRGRCRLRQATAGHRNAAQNQEAKVQSVRFHHPWLLRSLLDMAIRKKELLEQERQSPSTRTESPANAQAEVNRTRVLGSNSFQLR